MKSVNDDEFVLPRVPVSAGALIFDRRDRLLILKPTYKSGWTIPGGIMEADGETPWQACQREVREECGLEVTRGRLACMDFRLRRDDKPGGIRFLFDCGSLADSALSPNRAPARRDIRAPACAGGRGAVVAARADPPPGQGCSQAHAAASASTPSFTWRTATPSRRCARHSEAGHAQAKARTIGASRLRSSAPARSGSDT